MVPKCRCGADRQSRYHARMRHRAEYGGGGPDAHFRTVVSDDAPWDSAFSPAFDAVVEVVQDWAFQRERWRVALQWKRLEFDR